MKADLMSVHDAAALASLPGMTGATGVGGVAAADLTLAEQVYRALRRDIVSGTIAAGQPLRLEFLKQRYGLSFSPIREALNRLQSERLVQSTASRGFRVAPFSHKEMWDAANTRILIDGEALRRSLAHATDEWEAGLVGAFHTLTLAVNRLQSVELNDSEGDEILEQRHLAFHRALLAGCDSVWLLELSGQLYAHTERYRRPALPGMSGWGPARDIETEHRALLDAALARDAEQAVALLSAHYRSTVELIEQALARR